MSERLSGSAGCAGDGIAAAACARAGIDVSHDEIQVPEHRYSLLFSRVCLDNYLISNYDSRPNDGPACPSGPTLAQVTAGPDQGRAVGALVVAPEIITEETGIGMEGTDWTRVMKEIVLPMSIQERKDRGQKAKEAFEREREMFQQRMMQLQCYVEN